jgi:tetrahydromethanopterin S-methyltransferase subunit B
MSKEDRIEYLEEERKKLWAKILTLEEELGKKTTDYEADAKLASQQTLEYRSISEDGKNKILSDLEGANEKLQELKKVSTSFEQLSNEIIDESNSAKENSSSIASIYEEVKKKAATITTKIEEIETIFENKPEIDEKLVKLKDVFTRGDEYDSKLSLLHKSISERKKEIDALYFQIIGYTEKNEDDEEVEVKGQKAELEEAFTQLKLNFEEISKQLAELELTTKKEYDSFSQDRAKIFTENINQWEDRYSKIEKTIESLLPRALTAGLSYAYSDKKNVEETESKTLAKTFYIAIIGLIIVSLIPFAISINSIYNNTPLSEVILRVPRLVFAILPLYVPVLWVAYSSNRKLNLSKRLIEEYSHKEVLSKTFEGLSKQINDIDDKDISSDLKIKLLYNILEVNSENPGKLISDYNKSDHPVMDALDKSIKLSDAITKLAKIPGFTKLASSLAKKAEESLERENAKASSGIESLDPNVKVKNNGTPTKS